MTRMLMIYKKVPPIQLQRIKYQICNIKINVKYYILRGTLLEITL